MSAHVSVLKPPFSERRDREFLPAALEILETPPAPLHQIFLLVICALVGATLVWSYFSRVDIVAVAQGKVQPTGRVKLVQPVEAGKVVALHVTNGMHVTASQIVIELDPGEAKAEEAALAAEFMASKGEIARRKMAIEIGLVRSLSAAPPIRWPPEISDEVRVRENGVLAGEVAQLGSTVTSLQAQFRQKEAERDRLRATIDSEQQLISTLTERVEMRRTLVQKNAGSKAALIDALETLQTQKTTLTTQVGQERESVANLEVLTSEVKKAFDTFNADNGQKLAEAERRADDAEQRLAKARVKTDHMFLRSPNTGTVQALSVTTIGQVVAAGDELMRIVPDGSGLEIECYLPNSDAGFVRAGQSAVMKIEAFPFTRYGSIEAVVTRVADDAIPEPDAQQVEGNGAKSLHSMFSGAERMQNLVFPITLKPNATLLVVDGRSVSLSPGMAVTVEVRTGSRRILEYLFSPIAEVTSRAMKER